MFRSRDLMKMFELKHQDLQYLVIGGFVTPADTISKGSRGRRLFDLKNVFEVGVLSALRMYRVEYRIGHVLLVALKEILDDFHADIENEPSTRLFRMLADYRPFETLEVPSIHYYLDFKDDKWAGMHLKTPGTPLTLHLDLGFKLDLVKKGQHKDEYHVVREALREKEGDVFWTEYRAFVSIDLTEITRRIAEYVEENPKCLKAE